MIFYSEGTPQTMRIVPLTCCVIICISLAEQMQLTPMCVLIPGVVWSIGFKRLWWPTLTCPPLKPFLFLESCQILFPTNYIDTKRDTVEEDQHMKQLNDRANYGIAVLVSQWSMKKVSIRAKPRGKNRVKNSKILPVISFYWLPISFTKKVFLIHTLSSSLNFTCYFKCISLVSVCSLTYFKCS